MVCSLQKGGRGESRHLEVTNSIRKGSIRERNGGGGKQGGGTRMQRGWTWRKN